MTTAPTIKDIVKRLKNRIGYLVEFQHLHEEAEAREDPNGVLSNLIEILGGIV